MVQIDLDDPRFAQPVHTVHGVMRWYRDTDKAMRLRLEPVYRDQHIAVAFEGGSAFAYQGPNDRRALLRKVGLTTDEAFRFIFATLRDNNLLTEDTPAMDNPTPTTTIRYEPSPPEPEPLPYIKDLPPLTVFRYGGDLYMRATGSSGENAVALYGEAAGWRFSDNTRPDAILPCTITIHTET